MLRTYVSIGMFLVAAALVGESRAAKVSVGVNVGAVADWGTDYTFIDLMKTGRGWYSISSLATVGNASGWHTNAGNQFPLDSNGYPTVIPHNANQALCIWDTKDADDLFPWFGDCVLLFDGDGDIAAAGWIRVKQKVNANKYIVNIDRANGNLRAEKILALAITRSVSGNHVRNIRLLLPGWDETTYRESEQPFNPMFLAKLQSFSTLRFMDFAMTNCSSTRTWATRRTPTYWSQSLVAATRADANTWGGTAWGLAEDMGNISMMRMKDRGVAIEYMIKLCNILNRDAWYCLPHEADADFAQKAAQLWYDGLKPDRKLHLEYSNEVWNWGSAFKCQNYYKDKYHLFAVPGFQAFNSVFADSPGRINFVAVGWGAPGQTSYVRNQYDAYTNGGMTVGGVSVDGYVGHGIGVAPDPALTIQKIIDERIPTLAGDHNYVNTKAVAPGRPLMLYEAGQHVDASDKDRVLAYHKHPLMYQLYTKLLNRYETEGVGLTMLFNHVGWWHATQSFGLLNSIAQPVDSSPKYKAVLDYIGPTASVTIRPEWTAGSVGVRTAGRFAGHVSPGGMLVVRGADGVTIYTGSRDTPVRISTLDGRTVMTARAGGAENSVAVAYNTLPRGMCVVTVGTQSATVVRAR